MPRTRSGKVTSPQRRLRSRGRTSLSPLPSRSAVKSTSSGSSPRKAHKPSPRVTRSSRRRKQQQDDPDDPEEEQQEEDDQEQEQEAEEEPEAESSEEEQANNSKRKRKGSKKQKKGAAQPKKKSPAKRRKKRKAAKSEDVLRSPRVDLPTRRRIVSAVSAVISQGGKGKPKDVFEKAKKRLPSHISVNQIKTNYKSVVAAASSTELVGRPKRRREPVPWSAQEVKALRKGVKMYGTKWAKMLKDEDISANFKSSRLNTDLKDKWRLLQKADRAQRLKLTEKQYQTLERASEEHDDDWAAIRENVDFKRKLDAQQLEEAFNDYRIRNRITKRPKRRFSVLAPDDLTTELAVYKSRTRHDAAEKAARKGHKLFALREKGTVDVFVYKGWRESLDMPRVYTYYDKKAGGNVSKEYTTVYKGRVQFLGRSGTGSRGGQLFNLHRSVKTVDEAKELGFVPTASPVPKRRKGRGKSETEDESEEVDDEDSAPAKVTPKSKPSSSSTSKKRKKSKKKARKTRKRVKRVVNVDENDSTESEDDLVDDGDEDDLFDEEALPRTPQARAPMARIINQKSPTMSLISSKAQSRTASPRVGRSPAVDRQYWKHFRGRLAELGVSTRTAAQELFTIVDSDATLMQELGVTFYEFCKLKRSLGVLQN